MMDDQTSKPKTLTTGYFGKLPTQGDFVSTGLNHALTSELDGWLRQCVRDSQKALGRKWLDLFLISPVWRGVAARGVLHHDPVMMVMIPSVDRVGRYFPLVLAAQFRGGDHDLTEMPQLAGDWYDWAEGVALSILKPGFTRTQLDLALADSEFSFPYETSVAPMTDGQDGATLWWTAATSNRPQMFTGMPYAENFHNTMMQPPANQSVKFVSRRASADGSPPDTHIAGVLLRRGRIERHPQQPSNRRLRHRAGWASPDGRQRARHASRFARCCRRRA